MATLEKILYVSVMVSDQDRALDFYTNAVGLKVGVDLPTSDGGGRFLTVGVEGQDFELVLWPARRARRSRRRAASRPNTRSR